ncbi:MAG: hypothetical protein ACTSYB_18330 [Candidatus Helarchaeota archaeon]
MRLERDVEELQKQCEKTKLNREEFETRKLNLSEEIKKVRFEILQLREKLNVKSEKEKVILDELELLSERFQTDIDDDTGIATIYLSISLDTHFTIDLDCSKYPDPPYLFIPETLNDLFEGNFISQIKTLRKWSSKKPPHLVEIFDEIEKKLVERLLPEEENMNDREKRSYRRKLIQSARDAENKGDLSEAVNLYREVVKISRELKDKQAIIRYEKKLKDIEINAK